MAIYINISTLVLGSDFPFLYLECMTVHCEKFTAQILTLLEFHLLHNKMEKPLLNRYRMLKDTTNEEAE